MGGGDSVFAANGLSARVPEMMAVVVVENGEVILVMVTAWLMPLVLTFLLGKAQRLCKNPVSMLSGSVVCSLTKGFLSPAAVFP